MVVGARPAAAGPDEAALEAGRSLARDLLEQGASPSHAVREVVERLRLPRNLAYDIVQESKRR